MGLVGAAQAGTSADGALDTCTEPLTVWHRRRRSALHSWSDAARSLVTRPDSDLRSRNTPVPGATLTSMPPDTEARSARPRATRPAKMPPLAVLALTLPTACATRNEPDAVCALTSAASAIWTWPDIVLISAGPCTV